jgi:iron complex transport system permease protein
VRARVWLLLVAALVVASLAAIAFGSVSLSPLEVWHALRGGEDATAEAIVRTLRAPRVALGLAVGAGLAMSGAALQSALRNPLAEPYLLGVSGGAAVGAVFAVSAGLADSGALPLAAFAGAVLAVTLVVLIAQAAGAPGDARVLLMAGVVIGAFANAAILVALADAPADRERGALWWMMGSLNGATWTGAGWVLAWVFAGGAVLLGLARELDVLALGDDPAAALGVDVERASRRAFLAASLLAAVTVSGAGLVGFVGLLVPSLVRALGARSARTVVGAAALGGATLVVIADLAARTVRAPSELPLGAITALLGVPFFLARLRRLA